MTNEQKRQAIREFFTAPNPQIHPRTLVVGGCAAFVGTLAVLSGDGCTGVVVAGLGTLYALLLPIRIRAKPGEAPNETQLVSVLYYPTAKDRFHRRATPDQVMSWLMEDLSTIKDASRDLLDLGETTRDPICVLGPLYSEMVAGIDPDLVLRRQVPGGYLYSTYRISVFHFSDMHLAAYQCNFNLIRNLVTAEQTAEFFYQDVVAVRLLTESPDQILKSGEKLTQSRVFSLTAASGDSIRMVIDDPVIKSGERLRSLGDQAAANIRAMLRQYKAPIQESS